MSSSRLPTRGSVLARAVKCYLSCNVHQIAANTNALGALKHSFQPIKRARVTGIDGARRAYATSSGQRHDVQRYRKDVDERGRLGYYVLSKQQGALHMESAKANAIVKEFLAKQKTMDHRSNIQHLATKYRVSIEDLASLAIVTFKVPDISDKKRRAEIPPSQNAPLGGCMLQGCAQAEEPLAIMQVLTAVYLAGSTDGAPYRTLASLFPQAEVAKYRKILETLCTKAKTFPLGPEVLTLQGLFLEREGRTDRAKELYTEAVQRCHFKFTPGSRHPLQLPLVTPWNALGYLLKTEKTPDAQMQARECFKKGAVEGDDPLSCHELATLLDKADPDWLLYTSKAAASGHRQATVDLADFYHEASSKDSPLLENSLMRKALNWLLEWKRGDPAILAREWLQAASSMDHKPSALQLADYHESIGDKEGTKDYLRKVAELPSSPGQTEEWPQLVQAAKRRLAGITT
ncbi:hypothetical protein HBI53_156660 [Parastagonospora nodorum]|nr:hypothetical protein HBI53_156660 [Parastagonospora nodorum]